SLSVKQLSPVRARINANAGATRGSESDVRRGVLGQGLARRAAQGVVVQSQVSQGAQVRRVDQGAGAGGGGGVRPQVEGGEGGQLRRGGERAGAGVLNAGEGEVQVGQARQRVRAGQHGCALVADLLVAAHDEVGQPREVGGTGEGAQAGR